MHTYIKTGILSFIQCRGTSPVLMEDWKKVVKIGAASVDSPLSFRGPDMVWAAGLVGT